MISDKPLSQRPIYGVVLAAGEGTRMKSSVPKPLHKICGRSLLGHVLFSLPSKIVEKVIIVVGSNSEDFVQEVQSLSLEFEVVFVEQTLKRGTADAVAVAVEYLSKIGQEIDILVLSADTPLLKTSTLESFIDTHRNNSYDCTLMTALVDDPFGYGRIIRNKNQDVEKIVEQTDADDFEKQIREINAGIYCFYLAELITSLSFISPDNAQNEYYLTDVIQHQVSKQLSMGVFCVPDPIEIYGVNNKLQLSFAQTAMRERINQTWIQNGVHIVDPSNAYIDIQVILDQDVVILPGSILSGQTQVGAGSQIGPNSELNNCIIGQRAVINHSALQNCQVGPNCKVGPFTVIEANVVLDEGTVGASFSTISSNNNNK